jgi:YHYH protein
MNHGHEVRHLSEVDRRRFLQLSGIATGLVFANSILSLESAAALPIAKLSGFTAFAKTVRVFKSGKYYLVESNGIPAHQMMVGIKSWQQQVPIVQNYAGTNAWSIPIKPVIATNPMSAKEHFLRGAIAIAVNGVPIFNALNNRGDDALLAGELDDWGGHCGRADDYHYHIAPTHLQSVVGKKVPIAYALDGFPIYGETEVDGKKVTGLDGLNGHFDSKKNYHYHATKSYPYINGGFKGVVAEIEGQVDPQASTKAFRPAGEPLRGAVITGLDRIGDSTFDLKYTLNGSDFHVKYTASLKEVTMQFIDSTGSTRTEVYQRK